MRGKNRQTNFSTPCPYRVITTNKKTLHTGPPAYDLLLVRMAVLCPYGDLDLGCHVGQPCSSSAGHTVRARPTAQKLLRVTNEKKNLEGLLLEESLRAKFWNQEPPHSFLCFLAYSINPTPFSVKPVLSTGAIGEETKKAVLDLKS